MRKKPKLTLADWQADSELSKIMEECPRGTTFISAKNLYTGGYSLKELFEENPDGYIVFEDDDYAGPVVSIAITIPESDENYLRRLEQKSLILKKEALRIKKQAERQSKRESNELKRYLDLKQKFEGKENV